MKEFVVYQLTMVLSHMISFTRTLSIIAFMSGDHLLYGRTSPKFQSKRPKRAWGEVRYPVYVFEIPHRFIQSLKL